MGQTTDTQAIFVKWYHFVWIQPEVYDALSFDYFESSWLGSMQTDMR